MNLMCVSRVFLCQNVVCTREEVSDIEVIDRFFIFTFLRSTIHFITL